MAIDSNILEFIRQDNQYLTHLNLSQKNLTNADLTLLSIALKTNTTLKTLKITGSSISDIGARALSQSNLEVLILDDCQIGDEGAKDLAQSKLRELHIGKCIIGNAGAQALALSKLEVLIIGNCYIGDLGAQALAQSQITILTLGECQIGDVGAMAFALSKLIQLSLGSSLIGDQGARALAQSSLRILCLGKCLITDQAARFFANSNLKMLVLGESLIGDIGAQVLAKSNGLKVIIFVECQIGDVGIRSLLQSSIWTGFEINPKRKLELAADVQAQLSIKHKESMHINTIINDMCKPTRNLADIEKILQRNPLYIYSSLSNSDTPLHYAVRNRDVELLQLLLSYGLGWERTYRNKDLLNYIELAEKTGLNLWSTHIRVSLNTFLENVRMSFSSRQSGDIGAIEAPSKTESCSAKAHLSSLIDLSQLSTTEEENLIHLFTLYPSVKAACNQSVMAQKCGEIANDLFPTLDTMSSKMAFSQAHLKLSTDESALLMNIFTIDPDGLKADILPDLMILLAYRYQAQDLVEHSSENDFISIANLCKKLLESAAAVEKFLSPAFVYADETDDSWINRFFSDNKELIAKDRKKAFAIAYNTPEALLNVPRNSAALATKHAELMQEKQRSKLSEHYGLTASNLAALRDSQHIDPNDSASQNGDDDLDSTCTKTTILALQSMQRAKIKAEHKKLLYHKCLERAVKGKAEGDCVIIKRLTQDIHSKLSRIFTGVLSVASQFAARGDTTYTDNALDLLNAFKAAIPEPITRMLTSGLITAAQFYLDYKELQRFLSMARNLNLFEEMDIINCELTGLVVEHYASEFLHALHLVKPSEIETTYLQLSEKITMALEGSVLVQLAGNKSEVTAQEAMDLGVGLYEGFITRAPVLQATTGYVAVNGK